MVFLSGSESDQDFYHLFMSIVIGYAISMGEGKIPLTGLNPQGPGFPMSYVMVFL